MGQLIAQLARLRGAHAIGAEVSPERIALASRYCVDRIIDSTVAPASEQIAEEVPGGVDVVFHTADISVDDSLKCVRRRGTFVWVGSGAAAGELTFSIPHAHTHEICWIFAYGIPDRAARRSLLRMISAGVLNLGPLITHQIHWREAVDVYSRLLCPERSAFGGIIIDWRDAE